MSELIVNLRNHAREERPVPEEIAEVREQMGRYGELLATQEQLRSEALTRLMQKALKDDTLADLLLVLGLV